MESKIILLLGGTGKVARRIAPLLSTNGYQVFVASRSGNSPDLTNCWQGLKFDWFDQSTWTSIFNIPISAIFLISPQTVDCLFVMKPFIDLARSHGVQRLEQLSASVATSGDGVPMGLVSDYIIESGAEYAVLKPTWFIENFTEFEESHLSTIRAADYIVTAAGDGKVPFVSCDDIAAVAYRALTDTVPHNTDHLILGRELFSYDQVADILTKILERKITHVKVDEAQLAVKFRSYGVSEDQAKMLAELDTHIRDGGEEISNDVVKRITGREPTGLEEILVKAGQKGVWNKL